MPIIAVMHDRHHRDPTALVGTPAWMSLFTGVVAALLPLWIVVGFGLATAVAIGLLCGYLWYVLVHYAIHHWRRDAIRISTGPSCGIRGIIDRTKRISV